MLEASAPRLWSVMAIRRMSARESRRRGDGSKNRSLRREEGTKTRNDLRRVRRSRMVLSSEGVGRRGGGFEGGGGGKEARLLHGGAVNVRSATGDASWGVGVLTVGLMSGLDGMRASGADDGTRRWP